MLQVVIQNNVYLLLPKGDAVCHITDPARYFVILSVHLRWRMHTYKKPMHMRLNLDPLQLSFLCHMPETYPINILKFSYYNVRVRESGHIIYSV
jgi:hypothetical protein